MKLLSKHKLALILFFSVFLFYLIFSFQTEYLSSDDAYFHLRQIEHIVQSGRPLTLDPLSYGGRTILYPPLFHYFLAFFALFLPLSLVVKVVPAILLGILAVLAYALAKEITHDTKASFFAALVTGFIPLLVSETLNKVSVYALVLPLVFYMIYCFMKIKENTTYVWKFVILSFILPLVHPSAILLVLVLVFYILLVVSESFTLSILRREALVFSALVLMLLEFFFYKNALLEQGLMLFQGGVPSLLLSSFFQNVNVFLILYHLGILTLVSGSFGVFYLLYRERNKNAFLLVSVVLSTLLLLLFKFIDFFGGMLFLGVALGILSSIAFSKLFQYLALTKLARYGASTTLILLMFVLTLSLVPSFFIGQQVLANTVSSQEYALFIWSKEHIPQDAVILSDLSEGHFITTIAQHKNVLDSYFLLAPNPLQRLEDMKIMYLTWSEARVLSLSHTYHMQYIYVSQRTKDKYTFTQLIYARNQQCFKKVQSNEKAELYQILC